MAGSHISFVRAQTAGGAPIDTTQITPGEIEENFVCVLYFEGREHVSAENLLKLNGRDWVLSTSHDGAFLLQVAIVFAHLPTVARASWSGLVEEIKRVYYSPESL